MYYFYSDGASRNNGKKDISRGVYGSFGSYFTDYEGNVIKRFSESYPNVTNNQMELFGFIRPIMYIMSNWAELTNNDPDKTIHIVSDSQYLIKGINEWMSGWKSRGWRNSTGRMVDNLDLWLIINKIIINQNFNMTFEWVRGHNKVFEPYSNEYFNDLCDKLANKCIDKFIAGDQKKKYTFLEQVDQIKNDLKVQGVV